MHIENVLDTSELSGPVHDKNIDLFNEKQKSNKHSILSTTAHTHTGSLKKEYHLGDMKHTANFRAQHSLNTMFTLHLHFSISCFMNLSKCIQMLMIIYEDGVYIVLKAQHGNTENEFPQEKY